MLAPEPSVAIDEATIEAAKEKLILRRDTHLDSLIERLREPRVRRVIEPIVSGLALPPDLLDDDVRFTIDLGLVVTSSQGLTIANPIYREVIPRALTSLLDATRWNGTQTDPGRPAYTRVVNSPPTDFDGDGHVTESGSEDTGDLFAFLDHWYRRC